MPDALSQITSVLPFNARFAMSGISPITDEALAQLHEHEMEELKNFENEQRKREYLASRILLKQLAAQLDVPGEEFEVLKNALGRPYGMYKSDRYFVSIAHTQDHIFCGISAEKPIGIDAEPVDRQVPERLRQRILHPQEKLAAFPTVRLWTIKEAFIKLEGQGLRLNMNQVFVKQEGAAFLVEINNDKSAKICSFQSQSNWLAIAFYQ